MTKGKTYAVCRMVPGTSMVEYLHVRTEPPVGASWQPWLRYATRTNLHDAQVLANEHGGGAYVTEWEPAFLADVIFGKGKP